MVTTERRHAPYRELPYDIERRRGRKQRRRDLVRRVLIGLAIVAVWVWLL